MQRQILTDARTVIVHDLDGTHYPYSVFPDVVDFYGSVNAKVTSAIAELGLSYDIAKRMNRDSYTLYGDGFHLAIERGRTLGMDTQKLRTHLDIEYHKMLLIQVKELYPAVLQPDREEIELMEQIKGSVAHGMVTQSHAGEFAIPVLTGRETISYFSEGKILGYADYDYESRATSDKALVMSAKLFNVKPKNMIYPDDSKNNFIRAKQFSEDILNAYIHHGNPLEELPDYIDIQANTVKEVYNAVAKAQNRPKIRRPSSIIVPESISLHL